MSEADDNRLIEAILVSGVKIPPMPDSLLKVLALDNDDEAGPREYARAIERDPAMSGAVYRVAGSPVMGLRTRPDTLEKAITVLGLRTAVAVVRSEALRGALSDPALAAVATALWQRMNAVADLALGAARALRLRDLREDMVFMAGIFHDCGVAVLARRDPAYAKDYLATPWPDLFALDAAHNANHAVVGLMVARNWQLPADVAQTIRHHHELHPDALPERVRAIIALVRFASQLQARRVGADDPGWADIWQPHAEALFRHAGRDMAEVEAALLNPEP